MTQVIDPAVPELLRDLRELTGRTFVCKDPRHGYVPCDGAPGEYQIGPPVPFAELDRRDKLDVLGFIGWDRYGKRGLHWRDRLAIRDNVVEGKPRHRWLEGTSFCDPAVKAHIREELIEQTFELSREIGFVRFLAENVHRSDPALLRLAPEEREAFLREWWDGARERMFESYREQVAGTSDEELRSTQQAYREAMATLAGSGGAEKTPGPPDAGRKPGVTGTLRTMLGPKRPGNDKGKKPPGPKERERTP